MFLWLYIAQSILVVSIRVLEIEAAEVILCRLVYPPAAPQHGSDDRHSTASRIM